MRFVQAAEVCQIELGENAVRKHDHIVRECQDVRRPPGALDDAPLGSVAEQDPVAEDIGPAKRKCYPREDVAECILKRQTKAQ